MEQMRIKHNETGRSMVEMLGVLAVVGVLSIGGVAGYRYAVDKMNANEIINELKKRAITASQQRILSQGINLSEYGAILGKYEVTPANGYPEDPAFFGLEIAGVPERVCNMILESDWALPVEMKVGEVVVGDDTECAEGANTMTFAFNNTLGSGNAGNGGNGEGNEGNNDPTNTPIQQCGENEYRLPDGTCKKDTSACGANEFWYGNEGNCLPCPTADTPVAGDGYNNSGSCETCDGAKMGSGECGYYCVYCPRGVACDNLCCDEGQQCKFNNSTYQYECVSGLQDNECLSNADCGAGQYCKYEQGCTQMVGTCESATLYNNGEFINVHGTTVYRSAESMSWYSAKNFCEANQMRLFNPKPYCTADEWSSIQSNHYGYCTAGEKNLKVTNDSNWYGWTGSACGSCLAFFMRLYDGDVGGTNLSTVNDYALCEK